MLIDPVATRGYPLTCDIALNSQVVEAGRPMGNATFTYDAHIMLQKVYNAVGQIADSGAYHWMLVDGDGTRLDFGPQTAAPRATSGIFSRLSVTQMGYQLANAGPLESLAEQGDFTYFFNADGQLTQIIDPAGNLQNLFYTNKHLTDVFDIGTGKDISFQYSGDLITTVSENSGQAVTNLGYQNGLLASENVVTGANVTLTRVDYTYDANGLPQTVTRDGDPNSVLNFQYTQAPGRDGVSQVPLANETDTTHKTQIAWGMRGGAAHATERVSTMNAKGGATFYDFDVNGNVLKTTLPTFAGASMPPTLAATYNANRQALSASDGTASGTMQYDANGMPAQTMDSFGQVWRAFFNGADYIGGADPVQFAQGLFDSVLYGDAALPHVATGSTDALGNAWTFAHNAHGQTTQITPPPGSPLLPSTITYNEDIGMSSYGYPTMATDGLGNKVTFDTYDLLGDLLQASSYVTQYNPSTQQNELTRFSTQYAYDTAQRLTQITNPDGSTFQNVYAGRHLDHTIDKVGRQVNYYYCSVCDVLQGLSGPMGWGINWTYDGDHQMTAFTDANAHTTKYAYGAAGELTGVTLPDNTTTSVLYNNQGLVRQVTNGRGAQITPSYDAGERLAGVTFPNNLAAISYTYNTDDTVHSVTDGVGTTLFVYFPNGWVAAVIYDYSKSGLATPQELDYTYNADGSRATMSWFNGAFAVGTWTYSYDAAGRLTGLSSPWNENTGWQYDEAGKLLSQTNANGTATQIAYNNQRGWPLSISNTAGASQVFSERFLHDSADRIAQVAEGVGHSDGTTAATRFFYAYDDLDRLINTTHTEINHPENNYNTRLAYDLAGNLTTINGSIFASYDAANKISELSGGAIAYDNDGNVTNLAGAGIPTGLWTWDDRSLLTSASANGTSVYYDYNAGGMRVRSVTGDLLPTFYIYDGATLVGEIQNTSEAALPQQVRAAYTWGANGLVSERLFDVGDRDIIGRSLWYAFDVQGATQPTRFEPSGYLVLQCAVVERTRMVKNNSVQGRHAAWLMLITGAVTFCILMGCVTVKRHLRRNETLLQACRVGDYNAVSLLLQQGANPDARIAKSVSEQIDSWLDDYPNGQEPLDTTALVEAAAQGHTSIVRLLIEHGVNINARCLYEGPHTEFYHSQRYTALHWARDGHHSNTMRALEQAGAKE